MSMFKKSSLQLKKTIPIIILVAGIIGLVCSLALGIEKMALLKNPSENLICNLNPVISCGSAMQSKQASFLGVDNSLLGTAAFAALATIGFTLLAGAKYKKWFWQLLGVGGLVGLLASHFLIFTSLYIINTLCPFCMVIWVTTIVFGVYITIYNIEAGHLTPPKALRGIAAFVRRYHIETIVTWLLLIAAFILYRFWYYYGPLLGF